MAKGSMKIPYGRQWISKEERSAVDRVLRSDYLTQGPIVAEFERKLAKTVGAKYAVAVANGTAALHLAAIALGLKSGDEVITTPISFLATANAVLYVGAKPVFADIDVETQCLDPRQIEKKITRRTKAIFVTDFAGHPADMIVIRRIAQRHGLKVVEDACHALGATYQGFRVGACEHSDLAVFSFHPVKHITTGEGGAIMTNDKQLYQQLSEWRSHGVTRDSLRLKDTMQGGWYYEMQSLGFNYRMTDIHAAIGIEQLKKLDRFIAHRRKIAAQYNKAFQSFQEVLSPVELPGYKHTYHLYVIRLTNGLERKRKEIFEALHKRGVGVQVHYIPIPSQPYYRKLGYSLADCPRAEEYYHSAISIPMFPGMTDAQGAYVSRIVRDVIQLFTRNLIRRKS